ncbi:MAG: hypothetical protein HWN67_01155 [Candidatus Helarchaeota archaeon]|nr:hypothetical protein [Candidatus Helarchaeota archaeon]
MTLFLDKMRGTPDDLYGRKVLHLVAQMAYPAVVGFLAEQCGIEDAKIHLRDIGSKVSKRLMKVYKPKKKKLIPLIKEFFMMLWEDKKIKVKTLEKDKSKRPIKLRIIDGNCGLCPKEEELEPIEGLNFCIPISGFLEAMFNELVEINHPLGIKRIIGSSIEFKANTIISRGPDSKKCIHEIEISY